MYIESISDAIRLLRTTGVDAKVETQGYGYVQVSKASLIEALSRAKAEGNILLWDHCGSDARWWYNEDENYVLVPCL